ncbi:hypothetical protein BDB00DRAFT_19669 [Zychaea mexicana]|uniref:uncharacterized protein n=1 Tax=Zychaea mexicana TaxID=64656 RepID=UPI0022FDF170|nr:uncharacterized protein BDB00DRAFT_19669 [Zychaea mexicana]KAI9497203.1 hypothetical protein BDB00DRAFT_19669 [Zychaea mexicana]
MPAEKKAVVMPSRKAKNIYENWKVYSKHGKLMFRCNHFREIPFSILTNDHPPKYIRRKAQWYLTRDLALVKDNEERAIMLTFEAKGDGHSEDDYMVEDRDNICVVCGSADGLTLHHVVPYVYRQWFPLTIKSKSSRDLVLLCKNCHDRYERHAMTYKKNLATKYDLPLEGKGWVRVPENRIARKAATALLRAADKIPPGRLEELKNTVTAFWERKKQDATAVDISDTATSATATLTESAADWKSLNWDHVIQRCSELQDVFQGANFVEHGQGVVQQLRVYKILDNDGRERWPDLEVFIKQWRQHFLDHSKPQYLSERWTVDGEIYTH